MPQVHASEKQRASLLNSPDSKKTSKLNGGRLLYLFAGLSSAQNFSLMKFCKRFAVFEPFLPMKCHCPIYGLCKACVPLVLRLKLLLFYQIYSV